MQVFNRLTMLTVASAIALSLASGAAYAKEAQTVPGIADSRRITRCSRGLRCYRAGRRSKR